jgi:hypothetical protein
MKQGCPPLERFEELLRLDPGDPRRAHLEDCPRCSARVTAFQSFLTMRPLPEGIDLDEARRRLSQALRQEVAGRERASRSRPSFPSGFFLWPRWKPALGLAAALALGVILVRTTLDRRPDQEIVLRGDSGAGPAVVLLQPVPAEDGALLLRWRKAQDAEGYRVLIYGPDLAEIARIEAGGDTALVLTAARLSQLARPGSAVFWRVATLGRGDQLSLSAPSILRLP